MKCELKLQQAPLGTNHSLSDVSSKLIEDMKSMYQKCEEINTNGMDFNALYHYLDLFIENEQERSFLMDRLAEFVVEYGQSRVVNKKKIINDNNVEFWIYFQENNLLCFEYIMI